MVGHFKLSNFWNADGVWKINLKSCFHFMWNSRVIRMLRFIEIDWMFNIKISAQNIIAFGSYQEKKRYKGYTLYDSCH